MAFKMMPRLLEPIVSRSLGKLALRLMTVIIC